MEEQERQRPGEPDYLYKARRILEKGAAGLKLGQALIVGGYMRPEVDMGIPMPGAGCTANVRPGVRCGRKPAGAAGLTLCVKHLAQAVAEEESAEELAKVNGLVSKLDALDRPSEREISRARSWACKLGFFLAVSRADRSAPRFWLFNADRTRLVGGGQHGMTFTALVVLLELPGRAVKAPQAGAGGKRGSKARRPAERPEQAAASRGEFTRLREARRLSREAKRAEFAARMAEGGAVGSMRATLQQRWPTDQDLWGVSRIATGCCRQGARMLVCLANA